MVETLCKGLIIGLTKDMNTWLGSIFIIRWTTRCNPIFIYGVAFSRTLSHLLLQLGRCWYVRGADTLMLFIWGIDLLVQGKFSHYSTRVKNWYYSTKPLDSSLVGSFANFLVDLAYYFWVDLPPFLIFFCCVIFGCHGTYEW